jgi:hypothetical protein
MKHARKGMKIYTIILLGLVSSFGVSVLGDNIRHGGVLHIDIGQMGSKADLVLIGNLEAISPPYETLKIVFYKITATKVLKGIMPTNSLLVIYSTINSSEGSNPIIESHIPYLLFLEEVNLGDQSVPQNIDFYQVIRTWKGIIPLEKYAKERRPFMFIEKDYGIHLAERLQDFREAMEFHFAQFKEESHNKSLLKEGTLNVYEVLDLDDAQSISK